MMCIAGKNDLRVPPSQGYEFYHALKVGIGSYDQILHTPYIGTGQGGLYEHL